MLEMLERVRSGQRIAEISLRQLSVGSCVATDSGDEDTSGCVDGTSKRLCAGTLVYNDLIGGRGISAIRVKAGAENQTSAHSDELPSLCAQRNAAIKLWIYAPLAQGRQ